MRKNNVKTVKSNKKSTTNKYKTSTTTNKRREQNKYIFTEYRRRAVCILHTQLNRVPLSPHKYFYVVSSFCFRLMIKCLVFRSNILQKYSTTLCFKSIYVYVEGEREREIAMCVFLLFVCFSVYLDVFFFILSFFLVDKFTATTVITVQLSYTGCYFLLILPVWLLLL